MLKPAAAAACTKEAPAEWYGIDSQASTRVWHSQQQAAAIHSNAPSGSHPNRVGRHEKHTPIIYLCTHLQCAGVLAPELQAGKPAGAVGCQLLLCRRGAAALVQEEPAN